MGEGRSWRHAQALLAAHGLRPGDPLMLLNARIASRHPGLPVRPQEAAAALLEDASAMDGGRPLRLLLDLDPGESLPLSFTSDPTLAWLAAGGHGHPAPDGTRRGLVACQASALRIDWRASLLARCAGEAHAVRLVSGTRVTACRAHDPGLRDALPPPATAILSEASGIDLGRLLWSSASLPARAVGAMAAAAGLRLAPAPMPEGTVACLVADEGGLGLAGDRSALASAYRDGGDATFLLALGRGLDRRLVGIAGGLESLASLAPAPVPARPSP